MIPDETYRDLFQLFPTPTIILNPDAPLFTIASINDAYLSILRSSREKIIGKSLFTVFPDSIWQQSLQKVSAKKIPDKIAAIPYTPALPLSGDVIYLDVLNTPILDDANELIYIVSTATDITAALQSSQTERVLREALMQNERFLNESQRVAMSGSWEANLVNDTLLWSEVLREIYEVDQSFQPSFETALTFLPDEEARTAFVTLVQDAIERRNTFDTELRIVSAKGNERWVRVIGKVETEGDKLKRIYGTTQDITRKRKTETALTESNQKYESLIQTIDGIVWEADALSFEFTFVSNNVRKILGYTPEEWLNTPGFWSDHIYAEDREYAVNYCHLQTNAGVNHTFDYRMITADGRIIWIKDMVTVICEEGRPCLLRGIMVDITESKLLADLDHLEKHILEISSEKNIATTAVLKEYVLGIEQLFPRVKCSILRVENDTLYNWASPSLPEAYTTLISDKSIGPLAGSCGTAAFLKELVIVSDIEHDPRWADYKHIALEHGLRACWSYPVTDAAGTVIATLAIYYDTIKVPDGWELTIVERSASLLKIILENRLNTEILQEANLLIMQGQELANFGNWQWDIKNNVVTWSSVLYMIYGLDEKSFKATFEGYLSMLHPDDRDRVKGIIEKTLRTQEDVIFEERIIRPDGMVRHLKSWGRVITDEMKYPVKMIGACLDITEIKNNELRLQNIAWLQSHVIRAPLATLMGLINLLQHELSVKGEQNELLEQIVQTAYQLDRVIKDISDRAERD